jgi:hypothetical protein
MAKGSTKRMRVASSEPGDCKGAGASTTLTAVLVVFGIAVVVVVPALALLFTLDQRSLLEEEAES